ncbi:MAG TPA: hypothetical protein VGF80_12025 [Galbitalea sp.]
MKVTLTVGLELGISVPLRPVDFEGDAIVDEQILVTEPRDRCLGIHVVPRSLQSQPRNCFEPGTTVVHHPGNPVVESSRCSIAEEAHFPRREES